MTRLPKNARIPCFLCGEWSAVKLSKKEKPYFVCHECGIQIFVRCESGITNLQKLIRNLAEENTEFQKIDKSSFEVLSLTSKLLKLQTNLDTVLNRKSLVDEVFGNAKTDAAELAINSEISLIITALKEQKKQSRSN